jgi:hypothetical protein
MGGSSRSGILAACLAVVLFAVTAGSGSAKHFVATRAQCKAACDRTPVATCSGLQHRKLKRCRRRLLHDCRKQGSTAICPSPEFIACSTPQCATSRLEACEGLGRHGGLGCQRNLLRLCLVKGPDVACVLTTTTSTTSSSTTTTTMTTTSSTTTTTGHQTVVNFYTFQGDRDPDSCDFYNVPKMRVGHLVVERCDDEPVVTGSLAYGKQYLAVQGAAPTTTTWTLQGYGSLQTVAVLDGIPTVDTPVTGDIEDGCNRWVGTWSVDTSKPAHSVPSCD